MAGEMREFDRIREKVVIRLDGRQVAWLVIGCVAIAGGVFAAGYEMGNAAGGASIHEGLVIMAPAPASAPAVTTTPPTEREQVYTYDRALVKPTPAVAVKDEALKHMAERRRQLLDRDKPGNALADDEDLGPRPADQPPVQQANSAFAGAQLPAGPAQGVEAPPQDAEGETVEPSALEDAMDSGDEKAIEIARANVPVRAPEPVASAKPDDAAGTNAKAAPAEPRIVRGADGKARVQGVAPTSNWTIQIKAFRSDSDAREFMNLLREAGYKPYVVEANVAGKGRFFRVRVGSFASKAEALRKKRAFEKAEGFATIITRT